MKIKENKSLRYVKISDKHHAELKRKAVDCRQSLQDYVNMVLENFLKNNTTQIIQTG
ncbi:MAG TPA: hypothetical protein PKJ95_02350 [Atribacterota bacterium]|nr:hypothetical protein [Atribacterota bacterium]